VRCRWLLVEKLWNILHEWGLIWDCARLSNIN